MYTLSFVSHLHENKHDRMRDFMKYAEIYELIYHVQIGFSVE